MPVLQELEQLKLAVQERLAKTEKQAPLQRMMKKPDDADERTQSCCCC
jgi:hypothetical protein